MRLLATKIMSLSLKDRLIQHQFAVLENPFIEIIPLKVTIKTLHQNLLFTSQNAVRLAFDNPALQPLLSGKKTYCVGEKTAALLTEKGQKVVKIAQNATELARFLILNAKNESFSFICGQIRMSDLETQLTVEKIPLTIHEVYTTKQRPKKIAQQCDGILFFSPSAVHSFFSANTINTSTHCFCIGPTTARAVAQYTNQYSVAKQPVEHQFFLSIRNYFSKTYD